MPGVYWLVSANILCILILVFLVYFAVKTRQVFRTSLYPMSDVVRQMLDRESRNLLRQIQALSALDKLVDVGVFLPPLRQWAVSPDVLLVLARKALALKPEVVVECGSGASTLVLARCADLNDKGHVYSLDHDETFAEKTRMLLVDAGLGHRATIIHAPLVQQPIGHEDRLWYELARVPDVPIDLLFVDGPPMPVGAKIRYPAGPVLLPRLRAGGIAVVDDTLRADETEAVKRWRQQFPDLEIDTVDCEKGCTILTRPVKTNSEDAHQ